MADYLGSIDGRVRWNISIGVCVADGAMLASDWRNLQVAVLTMLPVYVYTET